MGERLKGKVAIVTGAGSVLPGMGNGKATAIVFAREGAKVMAVDYNLEAAEETKRIIDEEGRECVTFKADVSRASDCQSMVEKCIQTFGRVDILHNNVGIGQWGGVVETSEEIWDKLMTVNVKSMFLTCKYVIPHMEKQGGGAIVNIASIAAIRVPLPNCAYSASKAAIIALTRDVALQYAAKGIRVNVILPGLMKTPQAEFYNKDAWAGGDIEELWRRRDAMSPTGKQGEGWDTAYAALFLASDEAKYITGTTLLVDGGISGTIKGW
ncbi:2,5-dichloro-2,5-cyclohexadiene-1,4-diol dehydrogenase LinX [subsurface metagenome]|nr:glucose 1-dehydrogenase [Dehalococcoidia bacterium]